MTEEGARGEDTLRRAEALVDRVAGDVRDATITAVARAREELEDIWAEAKSLSGREGGGSPQQ